MTSSSGSTARIAYLEVRTYGELTVKQMEDAPTVELPEVEHFSPLKR